MKRMISKFMDWVTQTFFDAHYVHSYKGEKLEYHVVSKLEYEVVSEVVTDKAVIEKANLVLGEAA